MLQSHRRPAITPFWNRIPQFFLYPLRPSALVLLAGLLVLFAVLPMSLIGGLLRLVLFIFFTKYCYEVLAVTAEGRLTPPPLSGPLLMEGYGLPFKQIGVFLVLALVSAGLTAALGQGAAAAFSFVINVALAASIMVLATSGSLRDAINPSIVFGLIFRIGWPYLALFGMLSLLSGSTWALPYMLLGKIPEPALLALTGFSFMYFGVIAFHLMGYVLYQYHERLGVTPTQSEALQPEDPELALYRQLLAEQSYPAALEELRRLLDKRWGELELHRDAHKLARLLREHEALTRHGGLYIGLLLERGRAREATEIYREVSEAVPEFRPEQPGHYLPIARMLRDSRLPRQAIALINGFHKRFPDSEEVPALYLLAAQVFHEDLSEEQRAAQILRFVVKRYPGALPAAEHYLKVLEGSDPAPMKH